MKLNLERWGETILGAIVAAVAVGFFVFASAQGGHKGASAQSYDLQAKFQNASGINVGSDIRISGVKVGVVNAMALDHDTYYAKLSLAIDGGVHVPNDSTARIATDGLLGGAYVSIEPGAGDPLAPGGEITNTNGAIDLLTVFSSMMQNNQQHTNQDTH